MMNTQAYEQLMNLNRAAFDPILRWAAFTTEAAEKCVQWNLAVAQDCISAGTRQIQLNTETRDLQKWVSESGKLAADLGDKLLARAAEGFSTAKAAQESFASLAAKQPTNP